MITREQMVVMMFRYANYLEKDVTKAGDHSELLDVDSVSPFATDALAWANGMGIITGKANGTMLAPQANTARAEAAAIIQRFMQ